MLLVLECFYETAGLASHLLALLNDPLVFRGISSLLNASLVQALENQVLWEIFQIKRGDNIVEMIPGEMPRGAPFKGL
jgi:hypothetical protein